MPSPNNREIKSNIGSHLVSEKFEIFSILAEECHLEIPVEVSMTQYYNFISSVKQLFDGFNDFNDRNSLNQIQNSIHEIYLKII